ncbi:NAD(P)-binding protein [Hymenopellis radicata]|nr:NAD(P)-binding protein [Hymenopellis radicata]
MSSSSKVYLITGANRGIGLALVNEIASKNVNKDVAVIAAVRDISSQAIAHLSAKYPGKIHAMKFIAGDVESNQALAKDIETKFGHVDTVVSCAAICNYVAPVQETPPEEFRTHYEVNTIGIVVLFQALYKLLKSSTEPKFIPMTSAGGSLTSSISMLATINPYCASKAALNLIARRIHFENDWLICFPLAPGAVDTDMARINRDLDKTGSIAQMLDAIGRSAETAATMLMDVVEKATREKDGGEFVDVDGSRITW